MFVSKLKLNSVMMRAEEDIKVLNNSNINNDMITQESEQLVEESKPNNILPLNSAVIKRIRLNISTGFASNKSTDNSVNNKELDTSSVIHNTGEEEAELRSVSVGSVLQNNMKKKLANVLQSDLVQSQEISSNQSPVIDMSQLSENWSKLDCHYQKLIKTQKRHTKKPNLINLNNDLWKEFEVKMTALRQLFHQMNQNNQSFKQSKRSAQQSVSNHKKVKT